MSAIFAPRGTQSGDRHALPVSSAQVYRAALGFSLAIHFLHLLSLPLLLTYDSHLYVDLADILGTSRFPGQWDFFRTPLFPFGLKVAFWAFGKQPLAVIGMQTVLGFLGIWCLGAAVKRLGRPVAASVVIVGLTLFPTLVAYEHALMSEIGIFLILSVLLSLLLSLPWPRPAPSTVALIAVLVTGYYYRPSIVYLAPVVAALYGLALIRGPKPANRPLKLALPHVAAVLIVPLVLSYPWQSQPHAVIRMGQQLVLGLVKQGVIPEDDPLWAGSAGLYLQALEHSKVNGRLPISGLKDGTEWPVIVALGPVLSQGYGIFLRVVSTHPLRYLDGVARTSLSYAGLGNDSENAALRSLTLRPQPGSNLILPGPPHLQKQIREQFAQRPFLTPIGILLHALAPLYDLLIPIAFALSVCALLLGLVRLDPVLLTFSALPLAFCGIHALVLNSFDRMAWPTYPILLCGLVTLPGRLFRANSESLGPHPATRSKKRSVCSAQVRQL